MVSKVNGQVPAIAVLDDDPSVLKAMSRLLSTEGWTVESFSDPIEFLCHAKSHQPRVVVIDIRMPVMDGLIVQARLREISPATRVIVLTGRDDPAVRSKAMNAGASAFFLKPVDDREFLAGIESALSKN